MKKLGVSTFVNIQDSDLQEVGGKGHSLSRLTRLGYNVPSGFVVTSSSFRQFIQENRIADQISELLTNHNHSLDNFGSTSDEISRLILAGTINEDITEAIYKNAVELDTKSFAVRSSSASEDGIEYSWAGQMTTVLGVLPSDLIKTIKICWSSFFSPQSLSYRAANKLPFEIGNNAVIIQEMIKSDYSGVAFSVDPRGGNDKSIVIEAVCGLGEALVSGKVLPIRYIFHKESFQLLEYIHASQKKSFILDESGRSKWVEGNNINGNDLNNDLMRELLIHINSLEKDWGRPVDVEWATQNNNLYILQCRPVTNR